MKKGMNKLGMVVLVAAAMSMAACDDQTGVDLGGSASLSFAATGGSTLLGDPTPPQNPVTVSGHVIAVSRVELQLSELEIEGEDSAEVEMKGGPLLVALPVNGSVVTPVTATVVPGVYTELEMKVNTVRIQGTFDGQPFDVTVAVNEDLETDIRPPLVVTETSQANLTVAIQISNWFRNSDGSAIDLRNLTTTSRSRLASNINASFDAFEDDDRSGRSHDDD
jgi:hypothetical protein